MVPSPLDSAISDVPYLGEFGASPASMGDLSQNLKTALRNFYNVDLAKDNSNFWKTLETFERISVSPPISGDNLTMAEKTRRRDHSVVLSRDNVCKLPFGDRRSPENLQGYEILKQIRIVLETEEMHAAPSEPSPRILCAVYTHLPQHPQSRAAALTWGRQCDGFLAFSTAEHKNLSHVVVQHDGPEDYDNMWQKTRSILNYLYRMYIQFRSAPLYDYFHIGGDDMYVVVPNLRHFLRTEGARHKFFFAGQLVTSLKLQNLTYVIGGPGYTLSAATVSEFMRTSFHSCNPNAAVYHEDRTLSNCLARQGVLPVDTRDPASGQQRYHASRLGQLYSFSPNSTDRWMKAQFALWEKGLSTNFSRTGLQSVSPLSIAFHRIRSPLFMSRVHAILYDLCNSGSSG